MRALSAQLYYMLIMVCQEGAQKLLQHAGHTEGGVAWRRLLDEYEPITAGRLCALLQELLHHGFSGDPRTALDEFEVLLRRYSALSGEDVSESLKVALVQKGITDDALKTHLVLHASRLSTFQLVREEVRSVLITRQALGQGPVPMDIGALDAKGKGKGKGKSKGKNKDKGKAKDKPDAELTCYYCGKVGHRKADCWGWQAAQKEKEKEKSAAKKGDTPKKGAKKEVAAVDVGSLEVGPLSVCASDSWILSVEVAEVDESWTTHNEDWVMVDSGAGVSACPVDYAPECEVNRGSAKLPLVGAGGDRIEHIGQKTVGYATRDGANVEIAFEAAKVRLLSVDSLVEKGQVAVFTDSGGFIIPRSALQVDPAVRKLSMKRPNGHLWLPLARRVETSVNPVMVAPMEDAAEGQGVDEKMDEELPVEERSARVVRKPGEPTPEERSAHEATHLPFRDWCPTASRAERPTQPTDSQRERRGEPPMVQIDYQFASEKVVTAGPMVTIFMATFCGRGAVAATQCSKGAIAYLAAFLLGQLAAGVSDLEFWW